MAIYHLHAKVISRKSGYSSVAAAAYRAGEKLYDERKEITEDYTRKTAVLHTEVMTPDNVPSWAHDRCSLWNEVEKAEKRKDSQVAREIEVALPRELPLEKQITLVKEFAQENFVDKGMIADIAIHQSQAGDGGENPHAHILLTTRNIGQDGFGKKNRDWNSVELLEQWRKNWADKANKYLEEADEPAHIDHRSFIDQGIEQKATSHMGKEATALERQGIETDIGNENREINHFNRVLDIARTSAGYIIENATAFYHKAKEHLYLEYVLEQGKICKMEIVGIAKLEWNNEKEHEHNLER